MMPNSANSVNDAAAERRVQRRVNREERAKEREEEDRLYKEENPSSSSDDDVVEQDEVERHELPHLPQDEFDEEVKAEDAINKIAIKVSKALLSEGKFSRSKLPKLDLIHKDGDG